MRMHKKKQKMFIHIFMDLKNRTIEYTNRDCVKLRLTYTNHSVLGSC